MVYDNISVIAVEKHKNIVKCKPAQPVARVQHGVRDSFAFAAEVFEMSKYLLTLSPSKPRRNSEGILKTHMRCLFLENCVRLVIHFVKHAKNRDTIA